MHGTTTLLEDLDTVIAALAVVDVAASVDPSDLALPGVWLQVTAIRHDLLDGYTLDGRALCIVDDTVIRSAIGALDTLQNTTREGLGHWVAGDTTPETVALPDNPAAPLPALAIPFSLSCSYQEDPA